MLLDEKRPKSDGVLLKMIGFVGHIEYPWVVLSRSMKRNNSLLKVYYGEEIPENMRMRICEEDHLLQSRGHNSEVSTRRVFPVRDIWQISR